MIINLKDNVLEFMKLHDVSAMDVEYVHYFSKELEENCFCDFGEFLEVIEDIHFEEYDPLIKHREQINESLCIIGDEWFISRADVPETLWSFHRIPTMGEYNEISEEDVIDTDDVIDLDVVELLTHDSPNLDYVRDNITILDKEYRIENNDGIEQVVNDKNEVGIILACNPRGQYWSQYTNASKDPQLLFYPELIKIVMEYHGEYGSVTEDNLMKRSAGNIGTVFNLQELAKEYNLDVSGFDQDQFNNLKVEFVRKGYDYQITFTGAASHHEIRHEIISYLDPADIIKL